MRVLETRHQSSADPAVSISLKSFCDFPHIVSHDRRHKHYTTAMALRKKKSQHISVSDVEICKEQTKPTRRKNERTEGLSHTPNAANRWQPASKSLPRQKLVQPRQTLMLQAMKSKLSTPALWSADTGKRAFSFKRDFHYDQANRWSTGRPGILAASSILTGGIPEDATTW